MMHCRNCRSVIFENDFYVINQRDADRRVSSLIKWLSQLIQKYGIDEDLSKSGAGVCLSCLKFVYTNDNYCAENGFTENGFTEVVGEIPSASGVLVLENITGV